MRVFGAILLDSYRELNARRLFWITLLISALVMLGYASMGFNPDGVSMFFGLWQIDSNYLNSNSPLSVMVYRAIFATFIVEIWLAWAATILALIATTTIFPDFVAGGAIDLVLCKPISRIKLFVMKYLGSLLFVILQVAIFCVGVFLCMGWRTGQWEPLIFAAIPVVTVFYSYLFSVNVLVGVWTRSALAALLLTMLLWFSLFSIAAAEGIMNQISTTWEIQIEEAQAEIETLEVELHDEALAELRKSAIEYELQLNETVIEDLRDSRTKLERWRQPIRAVLAVLPKTSETIGLLNRWLVKEGDVNLMDLLTGNVEQTASGDFRARNTGGDREVQMRMLEEARSRSVWYIVGTSLVFEVIILGLACWIFVRRDY